METREKNLDLLRVIAAFLVVMLHTSVRPTMVNITQHTASFTVANFFNSATRVAVPIFVLLSGAFLLSNQKNESFSNFYKKTCYKIVLPTFIASLIYMYYNDALNYLQACFLHTELTEPIHLNPLHVLKGPCFYHLWYMYMLIGLYLMVPILIRLKRRMGMKRFTYLGCVLLMLDCIIIYFNESFWPLRFINYLGYFILGDVLHRYYHKQPKKASPFLIIAIISYLLNTLGTEIIVRNGYFTTPNKKLLLYGNLSPLIIVSALTLFIYFLNRLSRDSQLLVFTTHTFNIYLVHAGILMPIDQCINKILKLSIPVIIYIPLITCIVFMLSYGMSIIINWITQKLTVRNKSYISKIYSTN